MSCYQNGKRVITLAMSKPVVLPQVRGHVQWASGLVVMTSRLQRGDRLFNSGLAHLEFLNCFYNSEVHTIASVEFNLPSSFSSLV